MDAVLTGSDMLAASDPLSNRGLRLLLELNESTGDPVRVSEITADHTGSVAAMTATFGPSLTPAKITSTYFLPWNSDAVRPGGAIRADLIVTERDVDYAAEQATFQAATDEAALQAYKLPLHSRADIGLAVSARHRQLRPREDRRSPHPGPERRDRRRARCDRLGTRHERLGLRAEHRRSSRPRGPVRRTPPLDPHRPRHRPPRGRRSTRFTSATETVTLDDDLWADAVVVRYEWTDAATATTKVAYDTATLTSAPVKVVTVQRTTPYPGGGAALYWLNRLKARGRVFALEEVGDYTLRPGMGFTASLPDTGAHTGYLEAVTWTAPSDRGTVRTRGAADSGGNVIDLWPMGLKIDQLVGVERSTTSS